MIKWLRALFGAPTADDAQVTAESAPDPALAQPWGTTSDPSLMPSYGGTSDEVETSAPEPSPIPKGDEPSTAKPPRARKGRTRRHK